MTTPYIICLLGYLPIYYLHIPKIVRTLSVEGCQEGVRNEGLSGPAALGLS